MICKIRLRAIYRSNPEVITSCGMIAALALRPENDVRLGLENLKEIADEMPLWTIPLIEYVEYADSFILFLTCASSTRA